VSRHKGSKVFLSAVSRKRKDDIAVRGSLVSFSKDIRIQNVAPVTYLVPISTMFPHTQHHHPIHVSMEMWIWRRTEKISWVDKISNEEVPQRVNETRTTLDTVGKSKHVVRACAKT